MRNLTYTIILRVGYELNAVRFRFNKQEVAMEYITPQ